MENENIDIRAGVNREEWEQWYRYTMKPSLTLKDILSRHYCKCPKCSWTDESVSQMVETRYRKVLENGEISDNSTKMFDIPESNLQQLECVLDITGGDVEHKLLVTQGINVINENLVPKSIFRRNVIPWEGFCYVDVIPPKRPGLHETFVESNVMRKEDVEKIGDTAVYNKILKAALRGEFMIEYFDLSQSLFGFFKSPFEVSINRHVAKFKDDFEFSNSEDWLKPPHNQWINNVDCSLPEWVYSIGVEQRFEWERFTQWLKTSINGYKINLRLDDESYWTYDRNEPNIYMQHLRKFCEFQKMVNHCTERCATILWDALNKTQYDMSLLLETTIDK